MNIWRVPGAELSILTFSLLINFYFYLFIYFLSHIWLKCYSNFITLVDVFYFLIEIINKYTIFLESFTKMMKLF